mmetsp:Transcript_33875/g.59472  ORF Transcript_33875/g.59472 Transcript_33875/m.59472 type:complete len:85 (+) Transcript_33875:1194-1448(+)
MRKMTHSSIQIFIPLRRASMVEAMHLSKWNERSMEVTLDTCSINSVTLRRRSSDQRHGCRQSLPDLLVMCTIMESEEYYNDLIC